MSLDYSKELTLVQGNLTMADLDNAIAKPMDTKPGKKYFIALLFTTSLLLLGVLGVSLTFFYGIGEWGNNQPVAWGLGYYKFRFLGWYCARRYIDFCNSLFVKTKMENRHFEIC